MIGNFLKRRQKIVFMYADRYKYSGSTIMRGEQLCSIVRKHCGAQYKLSYEPLSTNHKDCIIFLTKGAVTDITQEQLTQLAQRGNRVMLDPVDNPLDIQKARIATCVIAASHEALISYEKAGLQTYLVNHHVDTRLDRSPSRPSNKVKCGYFGELVNTVVTEDIAKRVDFIHVDTGKQSTDWLKKPTLYNLHYAVRSNNVEAFKPFLKGFTAAACHANIIIQRDQREAVFWLGEDYPYLLNAAPTEQEILAMLDYAEKSYPTPEWERALQRMENIRQATCDKAIADEFENSVKGILNSA